MIYENFLSNTDHESIKNIINNKDFTWKFRQNNHQFCPNNLGISQFVHSLYVYNKGILCENYNKIIPVISKAFEKNTGKKIKRLIRSKFNLLTKVNVTDLELMMMEHQDLLNEESTENKVSMIYYIEDSDGDTLIFDKHHNIIEQASPIANSAIVFESMLVHRGTPPKNHSKRIILNCIYELE
jgi:hypothetical protein